MTRVIDVPQVVSIQSVSSNGCINLVKATRDEIGLSKGAPVFLLLDGEVCLSAEDRGAQGALRGAQSVRTLSVGYRGKVELPGDVLAQLDIDDGDLVALVQRGEGVALKRLTLEVVPGDRGRLLDVETPVALSRKVEKAPLPEDLLPRLEAASKGVRLRYDVLGFLEGRETLHAWFTRRALGRPDRHDDSLRERLIAERLVAQAPDGSWEEDVVRTARALRELVDLGMTRESSEVQRGVMWLMARPTSMHNPGQWFGADELVDEQAEVIAQRQAQKRGARPRFRALKVAEKQRVMAGDDLIRAPCGPRIMWPSGLTLEVLLKLGYEEHPRVQEALRLMRVQDWCECAYQHGLSSWCRSDPMTSEEVQAFEAQCISEYRHAGLADSAALLERDMAHRPFRQHRLEGVSTAQGTVYPLQIEDHIQGCEFISTRALATVDDPVVRRFATAHLWRFASRQLADGTFPVERYGTGFGQAGILGAFARYDHPVAQMVIMRALPWIVKAQHRSGAWSQDVKNGKVREARSDAATRAVTLALLRVKEWLPSAFWHAAG